MSSSEYLERVRDARERKCVLRLQVLKIRSGHANDPIFIFEGKTDIGAYETWIKRLDENCKYRGVPSNGKAQVLNFRDSITGSKNKDFNLIYFFVDHDYDGLRGFDPSDNIFCTDSYSFENYLATGTVLESILNDEFECSDDPELVLKIMELYNSVSIEFCKQMSDVNLRLFIAANYHIEKGRIEKKSSKFVEIAVNSVSKTYDDDKITSLIPLSAEPNETQKKDGHKEFNKICNPMKCYRGKYIYSFFLSWLDVLATSRREGAMPFNEIKNIKYNRACMTERSLASRSEIPEGLSPFISRIVKEVNSLSA